MTGFVQSACVVVLLTASTAVAQPAAAPSKTPQPDYLALSSNGGLNDQLKPEATRRAGQPSVEKTATSVSQQAELGVGESLWHRWNDLP